MDKYDVTKAVERGIRNARDKEERDPLTWNFISGVCYLGSSIIIGIVYQSWLAFFVLAALGFVSTIFLPYIVTVIFAGVNAHIFYIFFSWVNADKQVATELFWTSIGAFIVFLVLGLAFTRSLRKGKVISY